MSYCRWSTDDYQCDLYCYDDCAGGIITHIAGRRVIYKEPLPPPVPFDQTEAWVNRANKINEIHENAEFVPIELPHAGESFNDETLQGFLTRLKYLKDLGYKFPESVITCVEEEIKDAEDSRYGLGCE